MTQNKDGVCSCFGVYSYEDYAAFKTIHIYRCLGTREGEECTCGGDISKCNFYPEEAAKYIKETQGCDFCKNFDFGSVKAEVEKTDNYIHANITFSGGSNRFDKKEQFNYCPICGRELKNS